MSLGGDVTVMGATGRATAAGFAGVDRFVLIIFAWVLIGEGFAHAAAGHGAKTVVGPC